MRTGTVPFYLRQKCEKEERVDTHKKKRQRGKTHELDNVLGLSSGARSDVGEGLKIHVKS